QASIPWQDTHVDVEAGQPINLWVDGTWKKGKEACSVAGMAAAPRDRTVMPQAAAMCLLVRVGDDAVATAVGKLHTFKPRNGGRLFVQANDMDLEENSGSLRLEIEGGKHDDSPASPTLPTPTEAGETELKKLQAAVGQANPNWQELQKSLVDFRKTYGG